MPCMTDLYFRTADNEAGQGHMSGAGENQADTQFIDGQLKGMLAEEA